MGWGELGGGVGIEFDARRICAGKLLQYSVSTRNFRPITNTTKLRCLVKGCKLSFELHVIICLLCVCVCFGCRSLQLRERKAK